jgi:catechol 2,3-dioxygenase-like lactoylglutathione lyase family enzyme
LTGAVSAWFISLALAAGAVTEVGPIGLTVADLDREVKFFTEVLSFTKVSEREARGREIAALTSIPRAQTRTATLRLGEERVELTEHVANTGRPIPPDSRSFDHWFQHIAIVVRDMDQAYAQLRRHKVRHVSTAPRTLPAWNKSAGGIKAFYFRDPEEHVLEIIWFPPGKGDPRWQRPTEALFLGIDHTAIVVSDTDRSLAFYRDLLGMKVAGESENHGTEQEHLNQVFGARLRITALRAPKGPGIELLEYIAPPGGRPLPTGSRANDLVFWQTHLAADDAASLGEDLRRRETVFVSSGLVSAAGGSPEAIVRDPDGHALWIKGPVPEPRVPAVSSRRTPSNP